MGNFKFPDKVIEYSFYALFFLVPLIWLPFNSELFEFNKMLLVYIATIAILVSWLLKSINEGSLTFKRTPLDLPIAVFLLANLASTIFSIDRQISIFGYYSRWNGGLLSTISYIILYYALVTFFNKEKIFQLLKILLLSSLFVAIYGVLQHQVAIKHTHISWKGVDQGFWAVNSYIQSFSTLGHANWLAAFLLMIIPFSFFFLWKGGRFLEQLFYTIILILAFIAFTFTYSRGGTIGFVGAMLVLFFGTLFVFRDKFLWNIKRRLINFSLIKIFPTNFIILLLVIAASWIATFYLFGNAFTLRGINISAIKTKNETQLASGSGSETGKIRLIVWEGALETFKHYPIFGSGVETFTLDYYKYRPVEHNLTGEWDFIYNKAHNEFVNYLATTGAVGFFSYLFLIFSFVVITTRFLIKGSSTEAKAFGIVAISSYAGYHAQNFFGFSVVAIALLFFTLPAFFFIATGEPKEHKIALRLKSSISNLVAKSLVILLGVFLIYFCFATWFADYYYNRGLSTTSDSESYKSFKIASTLRPDEPLYKADLGLSTINLAIKETEANARKEKIAESFNYLTESTNLAPSNIVIWQYRLEALYNLSQVVPAYTAQTVKTAEKIASFAPNEAEVQYNLANIYVFASQLKDAQKQLEKVVALKFNYKDAWKLLLEVDLQLNDQVSFKQHTVKLKSVLPLENKEILNGLDKKWL
ncbi:MAG: hypothetical protein A2172_02485 [Candidatus Woykebacteria bacterium RBG_13_40_15]|uniref:O-antigen ligase-related domain-containing protein n=1 Tax=Candidatus Woykebacteria bacterium RBG_13_40_15 TaxID=1802593 RepID=A0A1G1W6F1_9BACT|nr:MAG: hypothetical protein A2172_02485 [Candidatus Woykebacteria bacterium RBG_13_40_15]